MYAFDDYMQLPRFRSSMQWQTRLGSGKVCVRHSIFEPGSIQTPAAHYSAFILYQRPATIQHEIGGATRPVRKFLPGDMVVRPKGLSYSADYATPVEVTVFCLEDALVQSATTAFGSNVAEVFGNLDVRPFRSPLVQALAMQLAKLGETGGDRLHADALIQAMIHELWRLADGAIAPAETAPGTLCPRILQRIDRAIAEAPRGHISLEQLAEAANMSTTALSVAMKKTNGLTPYRYVLSRRVEAARTMIETTRVSLAEIAFHCGFSSQSHMTDVFRAKLGVSPGRLRSDSAIA